MPSNSGEPGGAGPRTPTPPTRARRVSTHLVVGVLAVAASWGAVAYVLFPALLASSAGAGAWLLLAAAIAVAVLLARAVSPRSLAIAGVVLAVLAPASAALVDLRAFEPLWVGLAAFLGSVVAILALIRAKTSARPVAGQVDAAAIGGPTKALAALGLVANLGLLAFAYRGWVDTGRLVEWQRQDKVALADVRVVLSAEEAYRESNGGLYDRLECVAAARPCIPGYPATAPIFLDPAFAQPVKDGYRRIFHAGRPAGADEVRRAKASPSSVLGFAYAAVPVGDEQRVRGARGYCGDHSGRICATAGGALPEVRDGRCGPPPACSDLR